MYFARASLLIPQDSFGILMLGTRVVRRAGVLIQECSYLAFEFIVHKVVNIFVVHSEVNQIHESNQF